MTLTAEQLAITAVEWRIGPPQIGEVRIVERGNPDGATWAVTWRGRCANKDAEWEFEPQPSSRDAAFMARCRYDSWEDAARMAQKMAKRIDEENPNGYIT